MSTWHAVPLALFETPAWSHVVGVFDLETTGIDVEADRIVTAHVGLLDASGTVLRARDWVADPGIEIPAGATAVHGITTARARAEGRPAPEVIREIIAALRALIPGAAGMSGLPYVKFVFWNALGGSIWATAFVLIGYIAGSQYKSVERYANWIGIALLVGIIGFFVVKHFRGNREHA